MKEMVRYGTTLAIICIVASGLLVGINSLTKPRILAQAQSEEEASLKEVMPQSPVMKSFITRRLTRTANCWAWHLKLQTKGIQALSRLCRAC
jgi:Na+-translocating ferredoxin:NAD+ oxidoreductase RnfG subunit